MTTNRKFRNYFSKGLITKSNDVLYPNFTQIGRLEITFRRRCLSDKKFVFSGPFWPPSTEGCQSFQGSVPSESPSFGSVRCWSYSRTTDFARLQYIQKLRLGCFCIQWIASWHQTFLDYWCFTMLFKNSHTNTINAATCRFLEPSIQLLLPVNRVIRTLVLLVLFNNYNI